MVCEHHPGDRGVLGEQNFEPIALHTSGDPSLRMGTGAPFRARESADLTSFSATHVAVVHRSVCVLNARLNRIQADFRAAQRVHLAGFMLRFEDGPTTTNFQQLMKKGVELPEPDSITDGDLTTKLWEVLSGLAELRVYLEDTDHLSDRELYARLYHDAHRQHPDSAESLLDAIRQYVHRRLTRGAGSAP